MKKKRKKDQGAGLSTTTMVDVLFILLIFFVLVSTIKKDTINVKAAKVNKNKQSQQNKKTVRHVVTITGKNEIYLDGKPVKDPRQLRTSLDGIKKDTPKDTTPMILLRPDAGSKSAKLIEIFAILNEIGLSENVQVEVDSSE